MTMAVYTLILYVVQNLGDDVDIQNLVSKKSVLLKICRIYSFGAYFKESREFVEWKCFENSTSIERRNSVNAPGRIHLRI